MKINTIELEYFRNFEALQTDFDDVNIIWGENAQGKTNLLEAIYLFTGAHSFRGVKDKELVQFEHANSRLKITFTAEEREQQAELLLGEKKEVTLNGVKKKSTAALSDVIKAVIFSPSHLNMIKGGPQERRYFIDGALCQIKSNYRTVLKEYHRALQQRNSLLKDLAKHPEMDELLYIWNQNLARTGAKMVYQRLRYMEAIAPILQEIFLGISSQKEHITLQYRSVCDYTADLAQIEQQLLNALEQAKVQDIINRNTTVGPHRDDINILINGKSARTFGSQGQQRSCVLALKLAEAELLEQLTGTEPVALLDDVMSELDEVRQDYILNHIKNRQVFITCCDKETILRLKQGKTIHIENGKII